MDRVNRVGRGGMGKKRKLDGIDPEGERTLYTSFVTAANSISQLYTQAVQQQRKSAAAASKQTLERIAHFLMREYGTADSIPKADLLHFLSQEYEGIEGCENLPHQFPVQMFPMAQHGAGGQTTEDAAPMDSQARQSFISPSRRSMQHGTAAMDVMEQQSFESNNQQHAYSYTE